MTINALRTALRSKFGARQYRITGAGEIHACGKMPNTNENGWYLFGFVGEAETENRLA